MYVVGINGSPRKRHNTATLVQDALRGAESKGAQTELFNLCDLSFSGCKSCFACKRIDAGSFGRCALSDGLSDVLDRMLAADAIVIGSPVYFIDVTSSVRALEERLLFPTVLYSVSGELARSKRVPTGLIFTMNEPHPESDPAFRSLFELQKRFFDELVGDTLMLLSTDTLQYDDYSLYVGEIFDAEAKLHRHNTVFREDRNRAFDMGVRLLESIE